MKYKPASIALKDVDADDTGLKITTRSSVEDILPSIIDQGIINPPILLKKNGSYIIVAGFRRISACNHLNIKKIDSRILDADNTSPLDIAKIAICDNTMQRTLNLVEEASALNLLSAYIHDDKKLLVTASSLGLPDNAILIGKIKRISNLPEKTLRAVANGQISLTIALQLCTIEKAAADLTAVLFETLKTGLNKQREMLSNLVEIAKREDISVTDILNDPAFNRLANNPDIDATTKAHAVRTYLKERRFPEISQAEKTFKTRMKKLKLSHTTKLFPPTSFEGEEFELNFRFKDLTGLKNHRDELNRLIGHPDMADILLKQ